MHEVSSTDFYNWKQDPITQALMIQINNRMEQAREILTLSAGKDPIEDNFYRGFIQAHREILEVSYEDMEENQ